MLTCNCSPTDKILKKNNDRQKIRTNDWSNTKEILATDPHLLPKIKKNCFTSSKKIFIFGSSFLIF